MLTFKTAGSGVTVISGLAAIFLPILATLGSIASPNETSPRNKIYRQLQTNMVNNSFGCLPCGPILDSSRFRIIGGRKATHHRPWMVFIELNPAGNAKFHCGGSIINKRWDQLAPPNPRFDGLKCTILVYFHMKGFDSGDRLPGSFWPQHIAPAISSPAHGILWPRVLWQISTHWEGSSSTWGFWTQSNASRNRAWFTRESTDRKFFPSLKYAIKFF